MCFFRFTLRTLNNITGKELWVGLLVSKCKCPLLQRDREGQEETTKDQKQAVLRPEVTPYSRRATLKLIVKLKCLMYNKPIIIFKQIICFHYRVIHY